LCTLGVGVENIVHLGQSISVGIYEEVMKLPLVHV